MNSRRIGCIIAIGIAAISVTKAQIGVGAGLSSMGANVLEAGQGLTNLVSQDSLTYNNISNGLGGYVTAQFKYGYGGAFRLNVDASYVFFPARNVTLTDYNEGARTANFNVGATLIPIAVGGELVLPSPVVRPYIGAQLEYTVVDRTIAYVNGDPSVNRPEIRNEWAGHNQWGATVRAGTEFALGGIGLDLGARYNMANLITKKDTDNSMNYLQVGLTVFFGDLLHKGKPYDGNTYGAQ